MSAKSICVFYSIRHDYKAVLKHVRKRYPDARITALVPKRYDMPEEERVFSDAVLAEGRERYGITGLSAFARLIGAARRGHFDHFIVLFASSRHRLLAAASGAPICECWHMDGQIIPLGTSALKAPFDYLAARISGYLLHRRVLRTIAKDRIGDAPDQG